MRVLTEHSNGFNISFSDKELATLRAALRTLQRSNTASPMMQERADTLLEAINDGTTTKEN